ncbi:uncharacterized protein LOC107022811 [Solanum pennellii]|uniref:Uncharacterized protein LOC107022811 n=1 Tax=Solanum pennellii TaxID=28526 RepID=A0ABM1H132_SOLPN|nr:uncharacterized protein LOC107022811 [Solanum pennellii]
MRSFVTGVPEDLEEEYRAAMLHDNMDLDRLIVDAQQVEESHHRKRGLEGNKPRTSDQAGSSTGRSSFGVQDRAKLRKGHSNSGSNACYGREKSWHMIRDCPYVNNQAKADNQSRPKPTTSTDPPKRNKFYAFKGREELEKLAYLVTGTLHVFSFSVYALLDP